MLLLNIANFDLNIESLLSGNVPFLLFTPMPVSGNFFVDAQELSIKELLWLQNDVKKVFLFFKLILSVFRIIWGGGVKIEKKFY